MTRQEFDKAMEALAYERLYGSVTAATYFNRRKVLRCKYEYESSQPAKAKAKVKE